MISVNEKNHLLIDGADVEDIIKEYGTPAYVMDVSFIENMCRAYKNAYSLTGIKGNPSYASKAFCCKEIYRIMKRENMYVDVVSGGELYTALSVDFPAEKVFFHGNNKTEEELLSAVENGVGTVIIDSFEEADVLNGIASRYGKKQNVMIRINPGVEAHTHHYIQTAKVDSKFGFSIDNGEAEKIVRYVKDKEFLHLTGLHCHIGSQIFEEKSFIIAVGKMTDFYARLKNAYGFEFSALNLGGGFGIWYAQGDRTFAFKDYTAFLAEILNKVKEECEKSGLIVPEVFVEPGRSIVGEAGVTLYKVGAVKKIPDIKNYLAVDGGMFDNPRFALYQAKYTVCNPLKFKSGEEKTEKYTVAGKCCESGDVIAEDVILPEIKRGDYLCVFSTGAYNYSMASNYNRNSVPPVIFVKDGKSYYAVKKQSYKDLVRNDV